jgi:hypothetical protein
MQSLERFFAAVGYTKKYCVQEDKSNQTTIALIYKHKLLLNNDIFIFPLSVLYVSFSVRPLRELP